MTRKVSIKLIETAIKEKWIRQLAFYHILKYEFNNGCIYDYRHRMKEIAERLNISEKTLYNNLNFLQVKDLVCDHANNLKINSIRAYSGRIKTLIYMDDNNTLWDVSCLLYGKVIEKKARGMAFMESVRRFGTGDRFKRGFCENPFRPSLSYRSIAKILNVSEFKAVKVMQTLTRLQVLQTEKQKPIRVSEELPSLNSLEDLPGYRFNFKGQMFRQFGNLISFLQFPVSLKRITIKQYKKFNVR
jgi:hypothetical protein